MWNGIRREDFGAERWFSQWCAAEWLGFSARLCFCRLFFISSSKLLVFVISSSIRSFSSELFSLLSSPQFFFLSVSGDGVGAQGLSTGIKSALLNFS